MAEFIDEQVEELQEGEEFSPVDEPEEVSVEEEEEPEELEENTDEEDDLPEKYRGKTPKEIIRMHQEAEKLLGRQSSEVGDLRKLVDNFIVNQTANTAAPQEEEDDIDFFDDPKKAMESAIAKHPKIKHAEEMALNLSRQQAVAVLQAKHPDTGSILSDASFQEWIGNSKVRTELFKRAHTNYDIDAADELFSTWKERKGVVEQTRQVEEKETKRQRKAATTGSGKGGGEGTSRKIYRRSDIINLMINDPDRYQAMSEEIQRAYAEKRVR